MDWLIAGVGAGLFGLAGGLIWGGRTVRQRSALELTDEHLRHRREMDARERAHAGILAQRDERISTLRSTIARLESDAALSLAGSRPTRVAPDRPTTRALDRYVARLRGLASVDEAAVVGPDGLLATGTRDEALIRSAALVSELGSLCDVALPGFVALIVERRHQDPLTYRLLPTWTHGAWLVARGRGGAVNPMALDTAISGAYRDQLHTPPSVSLTGHHGPAPADAVAAALASEVQSGAFRAAALSDARGLIAQVVHDGPAPGLMGTLVDGVRHLADRVAHWCGEPTTLRLTTPSGEWVAWGPGPRGTTLVVVGAGDAFDELAFERIRGQVRRLGATLIHRDEEMAS